MAKTAKTTKKSVRKVSLESGFSVPGLLGLACLLVLLCIIPWVSVQERGTTFQVLQVALAILLALSAGICLGLQLAANRKAAAKAK